MWHTHLMKEEVQESYKNQMRKGMLELCTLLIIEKEKVYASKILSTLKDANLIVVEGTLYPLLSRLKSQGLLDYSWKESKAGPPRKYYELTSEGRRTLIHLKVIWKELVTSINLLTK
jgi:PadR family transcriptional regulator, regulatory protein PadR